MEDGIKRRAYIHKGRKKKRFLETKSIFYVWTKKKFYVSDWLKLSQPILRKQQFS